MGGGINQYKILQVLGIYVTFIILVCELFQMYTAFLGHPLAQKLNPVVDGILFGYNNLDFYFFGGENMLAGVICVSQLH